MTTHSVSVDAVFATPAAHSLPTPTPSVLPELGTYSAVAILSIAFIVWHLLGQARKDPKTRNIPKGPRGWPIVGSFFSLTAYPELVLTKWQDKFGPIFSMTLGSQLFVVIGDQGYAKELLVTNGKDFSSRKPMFVKSKLIMKGGGITTTPYGDRWRQHRRVAATMLDPASVEKLTPTFDKESIVFLKSLLEYGKAGATPIDPRAHAGRFTLNNTLHIVFGTRTDSLEDPFVQTALKLSREFMNCTGPLTNLIDFVDFLQHIPTPMRSRGMALHNSMMEVYGGMIKEVERKMNAGEDVPECFAKNLLLCREEEGFNWTDICTLVGGFMIGGVETTSSVVQWFLALLPNYPEVQARAHAEIDAVIGRDRLPTQDDWQDLPYCRAIIKEVQRTRNPFWLSTPHFSTADYTTQAGEFIPKGTVVILNCYAIHHNPKYYPDPFAFNPERYLGDDNTVGKSMNQSDPYKRDHWTYGAGRRVCPGYQVAERELWLTLSRILWAFKLETIAEDPIDLKEYDGKSGRSPVPFRIRVTPRDENVSAVLDAAQSYAQ